MTTTDVGSLIQAVRQKDYHAQLVARRIGGQAIDPLATLVVDPDEEVRELAVYCLEATAEARAGDALVPVTLDTDPQVAMAAARALHRLGGARLIAGLMESLPRPADPFVRRELAMIVGRFAGPGKIPELHQLRAREPSPEVQQGMLAALARMGDDDSRRAFATALAQTQGVRRKSWLDLAEYIQQPWLRQPLAEVLDDPTTLLHAAGHATSEFIRELRACDLALLLIAEISGAAFSFAVTRAKNYSAAEIDEVRRFARSSS